VPDAQKKTHKMTQQLVAGTVGSYQELRFAALNPDASAEDKVRLGRAIATRPVPILAVEGDARVAERSFFRINQNPASISQDELDLIRARDKPNAIATRALIAAGTGHKYWGKFKEKAITIENLAKEVTISCLAKLWR
jgi:hypothetical protein